MKRDFTLIKGMDLYCASKFVYTLQEGRSLIQLSVQGYNMGISFIHWANSTSVKHLQECLETAGEYGPRGSNGTVH